MYNISQGKEPDHKFVKYVKSCHYANIPQPSA